MLVVSVPLVISTSITIIILSLGFSYTTPIYWGLANILHNFLYISLNSLSTSRHSPSFLTSVPDSYLPLASHTPPRCHHSSSAKLLAITPSTTISRHHHHWSRQSATTVLTQHTISPPDSHHTHSSPSSASHHHALDRGSPPSRSQWPSNHRQDYHRPRPNTPIITHASTMAPLNATTTISANSGHTPPSPR